MRSGTIAFILGVALCQHLAELPDPFYVFLLPFAVLVGGLCPRLRLVLFMSAGFLWAEFSGHNGLIDRLSPRLEGTDLAVIGTVRGLPAPIGSDGERAASV